MHAAKKNSYQKQPENLYLGILSNYPAFSEKEDAALTCDFEAPAWGELNARYALESIAKSGMSFEKASRLLHYFAPRLAHSSFFDNNGHTEDSSLLLRAMPLSFA